MRDERRPKERSPENVRANRDTETDRKRDRGRGFRGKREAQERSREDFLIERRSIDQVREAREEQRRVSDVDVIACTLHIDDRKRERGDRTGQRLGRRCAEPSRHAERRRAEERHERELTEVDKALVAQKQAESSKKELRKARVGLDERDASRHDADATGLHDVVDDRQMIAERVPRPRLEQARCEQRHERALQRHADDDAQEGLPREGVENSFSPLKILDGDPRIGRGREGEDDRHEAQKNREEKSLRQDPELSERLHRHDDREGWKRRPAHHAIDRRVEARSYGEEPARAGKAHEDDERDQELQDPSCANAMQFACPPARGAATKTLLYRRQTVTKPPR